MTISNPGGKPGFYGLLAGGGAGPLLALMGAAALTEGVGVLLLVPMLGALGGETVTLAGWPQMLGLPAEIGPLLALFVGLVLLRAVIIQTRNRAALRFEIGIVDNLRARAWQALLHCDWRVLSGMRQADSASLLLTSIDRVGQGISRVLSAAAALVTLAGLGLAALAIAPLMALGAVIAGALVLLSYRGMRRRAATLGEELSRAYARLYGGMSESLGALRVIKSFGREDAVAARNATSIERLRRTQLDYQRDAGLAQIALQVVATALLALLVWLAITRWNTPVVQILPLAALFARALPLLQQLQQAWQDWSHARPAMAEAATLIANAEAAREPDCPADNPLADPRSVLSLRGVTVRYDTASNPALDGVDADFPVGSFTAVVGRSGAGKSTLADVLGGLIAPDEGSLAIDGAELGADRRRIWRGRVAYVQQEPILFAGSVRDNLLWAQPDASAAQLDDALRAASAQFVYQLPAGIDTEVGEGGRRLSGGERQRVVLARALLRKPALLILDEATSALDAESDAAVAQAITALRGQLTIVIIGHRGELTERADRIICLENGRVRTG